MLTSRFIALQSFAMATPRPARPKSLDWSSPSHLTTFIRNLKLLQLNQRDDWPDITPRTLSPSTQNQRQRVRLVEWALYYLFTIWDPEGTYNVLAGQVNVNITLTFSRNCDRFSPR